jgi:hypothetical protein
MKVQLFALMLAVAAPLSAQAADDNRSYIEFGYAQTDTPLTDIYSAYGGRGYRGGALKGNWAFAEKWNVNASYVQGSGRSSGFDLDSQWGIGLGYRGSSDGADLIFNVNYKKTDESIGLDSDVWGAEIGFAGGNGSFSGEAALGYEKWSADVGPSVLDESQVYLRLSGDYHFNDNWSLRAEVKKGFDSADSIFFGPRYSF